MYTTHAAFPAARPSHADAPSASPQITLDHGLSDLVSPVPAPATPGLVALPGTGRLVWWTGRVAIGLRYQRAAMQGAQAPTSSSSAWIQNLLLS